jgi:hypothetical protein
VATTAPISQRVLGRRNWEERCGGPNTVDALDWLRKQLEADDSGLIREMVREFAQRLMSAEADAASGLSPTVDRGGDCGLTAALRRLWRAEMHQSNR